MRRVSGDAELLGELIALFRESYPVQLAQLREAIAQGNSYGVERAAHALKGSVGNFAAKEAFELAFQLETIGRGGTLTEAEAVCNALEAAVQRLEPALTAGERASMPEGGARLAGSPAA